MSDPTPTTRKIDLLDLSDPVFGNKENQRLLREAAIAAEKAKQQQEQIIASQRKNPLIRLYNMDDELLFITVSPQFQTVMNKNWFWLDPATKITIEYFKTKDEQLQAKFDAIMKEQPRHNIHNAAAAQMYANLNDLDT